MSTRSERLRARRGPPKDPAPQAQPERVLPLPSGARTGYVNDALQACLGQAIDNIWAALCRGDIGTSRWLVDHMRSSQGTWAPELKLPSTADPAMLARSVMDAVLAREISIETGDQLIGMAERHAALHGFTELEALKAEVARLAGDAARTIEGHSQEQNPAWLKLRDQRPTPAPTHPGNRTPAE